jgi:adenylosuccinate synthase
MPSYSLARQMIKNNPEFRGMYEKAMEDRADRLAEEIIELADQEMPAHLEGPLASAWVQQKRMQVDARKWVASKLHAKRYGERLDVSVTDTRISVRDALNEAKQRVLTDDSNVVDVQAKAA